MKAKRMFVCAKCKMELSQGLDFKQVPGGSTEKRECAFCKKLCYGDFYNVTYKSAK